MSLFKSIKNKSASAAASPAQSPRTSIDAQRPVVEGNTMTREQAIRLAMHNSQQKLPHHFSLLKGQNKLRLIDMLMRQTDQYLFDGSD
ncbi:hypothetical protein BGZ90_000953 [Linnemannia elongata]|nr:hypothetical protein BGZ90_000953 [Linnemannia elongata]